LLTSCTHGREICEIPEGPECGNQDRCCWLCPRAETLWEPLGAVKGALECVWASGFLHGGCTPGPGKTGEALNTQSASLALGSLDMGAGGQQASSSRVSPASHPQGPHRENITLMTSAAQVQGWGRGTKSILSSTLCAEGAGMRLVCLCVSVCVVDNKQTQTDGPTPIPASPWGSWGAVHCLFHTCGFQQLHIPSVTSCGGSCGGRE
jgi:hypothetical protein